MNDEAWKESLNELVRVTKTNGKLIFRTDWREKNKRIANHVKHRTKNQYLSVLARENRCKLEGVYSFRDMPKYQVLFDLFSGIWPVRNLFAKMILKTNKWTVNPNQRILVFSK